MQVGVPPASLGGEPSGPVVPPAMQSSGTLVLPTQSSHRSHVFIQCVTCVQGEHFVGSLKSLAVHCEAVAERSVMCLST